MRGIRQAGRPPSEMPKVGMSIAVRDMLPPTADRPALIPTAPEVTNLLPSVPAKTVSPHYIREAGPGVVVTQDSLPQVVITDGRQLTAQDIAFV